MTLSRTLIFNLGTRLTEWAMREQREVTPITTWAQQTWDLVPRYRRTCESKRRWTLLPINMRRCSCARV